MAQTYTFRKVFHAPGSNGWHPEYVYLNNSRPPKRVNRNKPLFVQWLKDGGQYSEIVPYVAPPVPPEPTPQQKRRRELRAQVDVTDFMVAALEGKLAPLKATWQAIKDDNPL